MKNQYFGDINDYRKYGRLRIVDSFSAAEVTAYALCRLDRARCFGRTTAGETDRVMYGGIPGALVGISTAMFVPETGAEVQGSGVEPHERVGVKLEDLREGRDPTLEAARAWLLGG